VLLSTSAQLFHKSHSYMFRHYLVILRDLVINTLTSYKSISNAAVGNTIYNNPMWNILIVSKFFIYQSVKVILIVNCITNSCVWNTCVTWQGIDYKLSEDDTIVSKHVAVW